MAPDTSTAPPAPPGRARAVPVRLAGLGVAAAVNVVAGVACAVPVSLGLGTAVDHLTGRTAGSTSPGDEILAGYVVGLLALVVAAVVNGALALALWDARLGRWWLVAAAVFLAPGTLLVLAYPGPVDW